MKLKQIIFSILLILFLTSTSLGQGIEQLIPFQATLSDTNYVPLPNGLYDIHVHIYELPAGGTSNWDENHSQVSVIEGRINLILGSIKSFPANFDFVANRYLGITIDNQSEMVPRHLLTPSFHAYSSSKASKADKALHASVAATALTANTADFVPTTTTAQTGETADNANHVDYATNAAQLGGKPADDYSMDAALTTLYNRVNDLPKRYVPVGSISIYAAETPPVGYLECNGQELPKSEYQNLYAVIGGTYGETTATFFLPDFRGYFLRAWNHNNEDSTIAPEESDRLNSATSGSNGVTGDRVGTKQGGSVLPHTHTFTTGPQSANHSHGEIGVQGNQAIKGYGSGSIQSGPTSGTTGWNDTDHTHSGITDPEGPETRPINISVMYIIKY